MMRCTEVKESKRCAEGQVRYHLCIIMNRQHQISAPPDLCGLSWEEEEGNHTMEVPTADHKTTLRLVEGVGAAFVGFEGAISRFSVTQTASFVTPGVLLHEKRDVVALLEDHRVIGGAVELHFEYALHEGDGIVGHAVDLGGAAQAVRGREGATM